MAQVMAKMRRTRLQHPLVREHGVLRQASWDEALKRAAVLFLGIKREYGGQSLGIFSCSKSTNELNYLASKFSRVVFESNHIDSCNRT
jgi:predicted molibdopterin-dependent oxidoreductase YjgC